jgi:hypothetical protein
MAISHTQHYLYPLQPPTLLLRYFATYSFGLQKQLIRQALISTIFFLLSLIKIFETPNVGFSNESYV